MIDAGSARAILTAPEAACIHAAQPWLVSQIRKLLQTSILNIVLALAIDGCELRQCSTQTSAMHKFYRSPVSEVRPYMLQLHMYTTVRFVHRHADLHKQLLLQHHMLLFLSTMKCLRPSPCLAAADLLREYFTQVMAESGRLAIVASIRDPIRFSNLAISMSDFMKSRSDALDKGIICGCGLAHSST